MKKTNVLFFASFFIVLTLNLVSSGVVNPYWADNPLYMNYGETKVVEFTLQNRLGTEPATYEVEIKKGSDIAALAKTTYSVPVGSIDTKVPLTIKIPKDYDKSVQQIELLFKMVTPEQTGTITLSTGYYSSFDVLLSEKPVSKSTLSWIIVFLIITLIVLAAIILVILKKRRR